MTLISVAKCDFTFLTCEDLVQSKKTDFCPIMQPSETPWFNTRHKVKLFKTYRKRKHLAKVWVCYANFNQFYQGSQAAIGVFFNKRCS